MSETVHETRFSESGQNDAVPKVLSTDTADSHWYEVWTRIDDPRFANPAALNALLEIAVELPEEQLGHLRGISFDHRLRKLFPAFTAETVVLVERLYHADYFGYRRDGAELLADYANWLFRPENVDRFRQVESVVESVERLLLDPSDDPHLTEWPSASLISGVLSRLTPAFSLSLSRALVSHPAPASRGQVQRHIQRAAHLETAEIDLLLSLRDAYVDAAVARRTSVEPDVLWRIYVRHAREPKTLEGVVGCDRSLVEFLITTSNEAAMRGLARRLPRIDEDLRRDVASIALAAILKDPHDRDGPAARRIYEALGPAAALALLRTGNDEVARGVARAWRWTIDDGIFTALRSHTREYVRRKMVPLGTEDEPYDFTDEEAARLRSTVIPALLKDRARVVRERAQAALDFLDRSNHDVEHEQSDESDAPRLTVAERVAPPSVATEVRALREELRSIGASDDAQDRLTAEGPFWQVRLFVQLVEDRISAQKATEPDESWTLSDADAFAWLREQMGQVTSLMQLEEAHAAFSSALGSVTVGGQLPQSIASILRAADLWASVYESAAIWRRHVKALHVSARWKRAVDMMPFVIEPLLEGVEFMIARLKAEIVAARGDVMRGAPPRAIAPQITLETSAIVEWLPEVVRRALMDGSVDDS